MVVVVVVLSSQTPFSLRKPNHRLPEAGKPKPPPHVNEENSERKPLRKPRALEAMTVQALATEDSVAALPPLQSLTGGYSRASRHHLLFLMAANLWVLYLPLNGRSFRCLLLLECFQNHIL